MWRILLFFAAVTGLALGFAWLADRPGQVDITWQGQIYHMDLMTLIIGFLVTLVTLMLIWWLIKNVLIAPGRVSRHVKLRNREKGLDAVSRGLIAVSAGDAALARKLAAKAGKKLQSDGLTTLLKAQAAQLSGDRNAARQLYEAMLENPETEVAGLRGLYLEARREKEIEAARQFADKAVQRNPRLTWSTEALLEIQSRSGQWADALKTLELARKHKKVDKKTATRQRAVLLTAQAVENEQNEMDLALSQALEAHRLAPDLVPAADVASRILAAQGNVGKASKIIMRTWETSPHPDLALTYAHARPGDSPRDRLTRVQQLAQRTPYNMEGAIAVAEAAIESHDWDEARLALKSLLDEHPSERVCTLMARIEGGEFGDKGRVREWLARAVRAPRDPAWTADGYVSKQWAPISPITGRLDAFDWKIPVEQLEQRDDELPFEEFIPLKVEEKVTEIAEENQPEEKSTAIASAALASAAATQKEAESLTVKSVEADPIEADKVVPPAEKAIEPLTSPKTKAQIEDNLVEVIEVDAVDKPVKFETPDETPPVIEPKTAKKDADKKNTKSKAPDIYIPPRLPDDPGPFASTGSRTPKLPQRFRHSQKGTS
ncbi:MAG: heme biosynthesis protein HemY [Hyphomicrobiaceae bacterium]|nr:heme biosynthesis protein HemY [Hyphomicrobiaceae bacterium]